MKKYVVLVLFIVTLALFSSMLFGDTFAKYVSSFSGDGIVEVAFPVIVDSYNEIAIPLSEMKPGDVFNYPFYVTNQEYSTSSITEVELNYYFEIDYSDNLPITFELFKDGIETNVLDSNNRSNTYVFNHSVAQYDSYNLRINWDSSYDDFEWRNLIDEVTLRLYSYQSI